MVVQEVMQMIMLNEEQRRVFEDRYQYNGESVEDMWSRIASSGASVEESTKSTYWVNCFYDILQDFKFVPGGRIMATAGTQNPQPFFNCYVIPSPDDSREGIMSNITKMVEIMARGGGVGVDLSSLRYKNAPVAGVNGRSSGVVAWADLYSAATGTIQQGGSRRGALLLALRVDHPDIIDFIKAKEKPNTLTNANLSVLVTDRFMQAVENGESWPLRWKGKVVTNVSAKELWLMIAEKAWSTGEPGIIFIDRYNKYNNTWYFENIVTTNPCGELGLPADGVCCLGNINLSVYTDNAKIDKKRLLNDVAIIVRFLDNMIDVSPYIYKQNEKVVKRSRRIGIGSMGLADMLLKLQYRYGSQDSLQFVDSLYNDIKIAAYWASVELAKEKGAFPAFDPVQYLKSPFIQGLPSDLKKAIAEHGIRNASLLTLPPTGSTGLFAGASNGIEPIYEWVSIRNDRLGKREMHHWFYSALSSKYGDKKQEVQLPEYAVTAYEVSPEEHIKMQATIQKHIDASISKTINLPKSASVDDVLKAYSMAYELGCKGCTVYRDGSIEDQVLSTKKKENVNHTRNHITTRPAMEIAYGVRYRVRTACGKMWVHVYNDENGNIREVFIGNGSKGGCVCNINALSRQISLHLRRNTPLEEIIDQLNSSGVCSAYTIARTKGEDLSDGYSCPSAIANILKKKHFNIIEEIAATNDYVIDEVEDIPTGALYCPICGTQLERRGCWECTECGYRKCE